MVVSPTPAGKSKMPSHSLPDRITTDVAMSWHTHPLVIGSRSVGRHVSIGHSGPASPVWDVGADVGRVTAVLAIDGESPACI